LFLSYRLGRRFIRPPRSERAAPRAGQYLKRAVSRPGRRNALPTSSQTSVWCVRSRSLIILRRLGSYRRHPRASGYRRCRRCSGTDTAPGSYPRVATPAAGRRPPRSGHARSVSRERMNSDGRTLVGRSPAQKARRARLSRLPIVLSTLVPRPVNRLLAGQARHCAGLRCGMVPSAAIGPPWARVGPPKISMRAACPRSYAGTRPRRGAGAAERLLPGPVRGGCLGAPPAYQPVPGRQRDGRWSREAGAGAPH
jgi:hypothetical protein